MSSHRKPSKDRTSDGVPSYILDELPVLSSSSSASTVLASIGTKGVSSNPYPTMARPRKSASSLTSQIDKSIEYEQQARSASMSAAVLPSVMSSTNTSFSGGQSGGLSVMGNPNGSKTSSIRRPDFSSASPVIGNMDGSFSHSYTAPLPSSATFRQGSDTGSSPVLNSENWRSASRYNNITSSIPTSHRSNATPLQSKYRKSSVESNRAYEMPPEDTGSSLDPSMQQSQGPPKISLRITTPPTNNTGSPNLQGTHSSALSPSTHVTPRSRNASGQHVVYPNPFLSVFWKANDPAEWTMDRVAYWLEYNKFGPDWIETFRARNIHGEEFLSLVSYQKLKSLGNLSTTNDIYDTRHARFIHILRKVLDKSNSNNSNSTTIEEDNESPEQSDYYQTDYLNSSSSELLKPIRTDINPEYLNENLVSNATNVMKLPVRNKSFEDLQNIDASNVRVRPNTKMKESKDLLRPVSVFDTGHRTQVCTKL